MNKKYWELAAQTGITSNDLLTFAKEDGSDYTTSYISLEDFLQAISNDVNVNLGPVLDNTISTPPSNPSEGDRYIVPSGATGPWSANTYDIAQWNDVDDEWQFYEPISGDKTIVTTGTNAGKVYEFNGSLWNEVIVPVVNSTPFFLNGTTIDAGSNKTSNISRTGGLCIGTTNNTIGNRFRVIGNGVMDGYNTRTGYFSTADITRTGKFFRVASFDLNYSVFAAQFYTILMSTNGNSNGSSNQATINFTFKRQNSDVFIYVNIEQKVNDPSGNMVLDENDIDFLWDSGTNRITMYYKQKENYSRTSLTFLNGSEYNATRCTFLNQYMNTIDLSGEVNDPVTAKSIQFGRIDKFVFNSANQVTDRIVDIADDNVRNRFIRTHTFNLLSTEDGTNGIGSSLVQTTGGFEIAVEDSITPSTSNVNFTSAFNTINSTDGTNNSFIYNDPSSVNIGVQNNVDGITTTNTIGLSGIETVGQNSIDNIYSAILMDVTNTSSNELRLNHKINKDGSELTLKSTDTQLSVIDDTNGLSNVNLFTSTVSQNLIINDNTSQVTTINTTYDSHNIFVDFDGSLQFTSGLAITNDGTDSLSGLFSVDANNSKSNNIIATNNEIRLSSIDGTSSKLLLIKPQTFEIWDDAQTSLFFNVGDNGIYLDTISGVENLTIKNLRTYANNADAIAGGLVVDQVYKTADGNLRIVI